MAIEYWIAIEKFEGVRKSSKSKDRQYTDQQKRDKKTKYRLRLHVNVIYKKKLKISKVHSESVNRRTVNTLVLQMETKGQTNHLQNNTRKTKERATWTLPKTKEELGCSGRVGSSHRVNLVTNAVITCLHTDCCYSELAMNVNRYGYIWNIRVTKWPRKCSVCPNRNHVISLV